MCVRHEGQLFVILSVFVHLSVCIWPSTDWGDKPKPIDGNWSTCSAWCSCQIPSHGNLLPLRHKERDCTNLRPKKWRFSIACEKPDVPRVATMIIFPLAWSVVEYKIRSWRLCNQACAFFFFRFGKFGFQRFGPVYYFSPFVKCSHNFWLIQSPVRPLLNLPPLLIFCLLNEKKNPLPLRHY